MTQERINKRPQSCQQILKDRNLWSLMDNELNINKLFKEYSKNCDKKYKNSYIYKVIKLMIKNPEWDFRYD